MSRPPPRLELGGPEPSAVLTPLELPIEIDRLAPELAAGVTSLGPEPAKLPGYAGAFDLLDAVIRQLSQGSVDLVPARR